MGLDLTSFHSVEFGLKVKAHDFVVISEILKGSPSFVSVILHAVHSVS